MWKPLTKCFFIFAAIVAASGCVHTPPVGDGNRGSVAVKPEVAADYQRAVGAMKAERDDEALRQFREITQKYPAISAAFTNLGILYLKKKNFTQAEKAFAQAVKLNPKDAVAYAHLGIVYRHAGKFKESKQAYLDALRINPGYALAHLNIGILYDIYLQDLPLAIQHYKRYQALHGGNDKQVDKWIVDLQRRIDSNRRKLQQG